MAITVKFRRGSTTESNAFLGEEGELYIDKDKDTVVVHDGVTTGGFPLASEAWVTQAISNFGSSSFSGSYNDLTDKPVLFSGAYADLTGLPTLFSGSYNDLTNKPVLFSGAYADLTGKPALATVATSGSYNDLLNRPTIPSFVNPTFTGTTTLSQTIETFASPTISANAVTLNFNLGAIFALGSNAANITANFTNIPGTAGQTIATTLIITQGATAYIPNAVTINGGGSITPKWQGGSAPSGTANRTTIVSFTFICTATNTWTTIGSLVDYN